MNRVHIFYDGCVYFVCYAVAVTKNNKKGEKYVWVRIPHHHNRNNRNAVGSVHFSHHFLAFNWNMNSSCWMNHILCRVYSLLLSVKRIHRFDSRFNLNAHFAHPQYHRMQICILTLIFFVRFFVSALLSLSFIAICFLKVRMNVRHQNSYMLTQLLKVLSTLLWQQFKCQI